MAEPRRTFGPVVLVGLAGSGLAALAGSKPWAAPDGAAGSTLVDKTGGHVPLGAALALVALAGWGVLLVTRGRVRRLVAALVALVSAALVVTVVLGRSAALHSARTATVDLGRRVTGAHVTAWWWVALVASVAALAASGAALRWCRAWPEMGSRYDAPVSPGTQDPATMDEADLWRALDQGRDPTDPDAR
jgi:uncharacterized membrane protein (TIGR02234 family)